MKLKGLAMKKSCMLFIDQSSEENYSKQTLVTDFISKKIKISKLFVLILVKSIMTKEYFQVQ